MKPYLSKEKISIGFFGHNGTGKTSAAEAMFFNAKLTTRLGKTAEKNLVLDFEEEEKKRQQSINLGLGYVEHGDCKIHVLDTPGFLDYLGEIVSATYAADLAAVFVNTENAVEVGFEKAIEILEEKQMPVFFVMNGIDKGNSDFGKAFDDVKNYTSVGMAPLTVPAGEKDGFKGIIDVVEMKLISYGSEGKTAISDVPAEYADTVKKYREKMIEAVAESTDELTEKYLETGELSADDMKKGIKEGVASGKFRPVFATSALANFGLDIMVDMIVKYFPKYADLPPYNAKKAGSDLLIRRDESEALSGMIFKIISDPHLGDIVNCKLFSGKLASGGEFFNINKSKAEKTGQIYALLGDKKADIPAASAGDIVSFVKLKYSDTGDYIAEKDTGIEYEPFTVQEPIYSISIQPKSKEDQEKVSIALQKINREDPSFKYFMDKEFGEFILSGMGDSHVNIILEKIKRKYGVELTTANPQVPYRETITRPAESQGRYKKQSGGRGQFGDTWIKVEPCETGFEFVDAIVGGVIPRNFIPSVEKGVKGAMETGPLAGYPVVNIKVTLYDGSYHTVDSSDMAFQIAGSMGFKNACEKAELQLLEPIYDFFITLPDDNLGDVMGDLSGRRGRIQGTDQKKGGKTLIHAKAPLSEMFTYINTLKSMTGGRGFYSMKFSHYEPVPHNIALKIIDQRKKKLENKNE